MEKVSFVSDPEDDFVSEANFEAEQRVRKQMASIQAAFLSQFQRVLKNELEKILKEIRKEFKALKDKN